MSLASPYRTLLAAIVVCASSGCAPLATRSVPPCAAGEEVAVHDQLYFGTARAGGAVTADEWDAFVARTLTQKLPDGFTVWEASGQWRDGTGRVVKETTHVLSVAHPDDERAERIMREIASAYRARFDQNGVYRIRTMVCSSDLKKP